MLISAPGKTEAGLTLVELLVVLLIVGMTAGMVVFAIPRSQTGLASSSLQVERDVASLRDAAVSNVATYALKTVAGGYARYVARDGQWVLLDTTEFPDGVDFELAAEGGWQLPEHEETILIGLPPAEEEEPFAPDVLFSADGSVTPFAVQLRQGRDEAVLHIGPFGRIVGGGDDEE